MNRIFLALKAKLHDYDKLQSDFSEVIDGRWIPSENIHITISYFGDGYNVDELIEKLPILIEPIESLTLDSLGYFKQNKILYAAAKSIKLEKLNTSINNFFSLEQTKSFIPHATLMRVKSIKNDRLFREILSSYENRNLGILDTKFELMSSHIQHPGGAKYECIKRFEL